MKLMLYWLIVYYGDMVYLVLVTVGVLCMNGHAEKEDYKTIGEGFSIVYFYTIKKMVKTCIVICALKVVG